MKRRLIYFPVLLMLIEVIATAGSYVEIRNRPGTFDIFNIIGIPFIFLILLASFSLAIFFAKEVYKIKRTLHEKIYAFLIAFVFIILLTAYGYLRESGEIVFAWDTDGIPKPSSGDYCGFFILAECYSAILGLIGYNTYRILRHFRGRV